MIVKTKNNKAIIDDVIEPETFKVMQEFWLGKDVPWSYNQGVVFDEDTDFQFVYLVWDFDHIPHPNIWSLVQPVLHVLRPYSLIKIKANLRTRGHEVVESREHTDNHQAGAFTAIFYIDTNDGYTFFEDGDKFESVENRLIIFPSHMKHGGTTCTNSNRRTVLNFNYVPQPDAEIADALLTDADKDYIKKWHNR